MKNKKDLNLKGLKKNVKGITLIALVVTVIVLLILAGIAINLTIGENGIFKRAQTAANTWRNAESNEQLAMGELEGWMDEIMNGPQAKEGTLSWMFEQAVKDSCPGGAECTDPENHLHIGDYVDFKQVVNEYLGNLSEEKKIVVTPEQSGYYEDQTYTLSNTGSRVAELNWRVLGYDASTKQVKLISGTPMKSDSDYWYLFMGDAESCLTTDNKGTARLDSICSEVFGEVEGVASSRSVKIEDINNLLGVKEEDIRDINLDPILNGGRNYGDSISDIEGWTPESFLNLLKKYGINRTSELDKLQDTNPNHEVFDALRSGEGVSNLSGTVTGYFYTVNASLGESAPYVTANEKTYDIIFKGNGIYWLSSPGVRAYPDGTGFGPGAVGIDEGLGSVVSGIDAFNSYGFDGGNGFGVRPVVSLESGVLEKDVPKLDTAPTEPEWSMPIG